MGQYERCEKTETEAAAELAQLSDGPHVLAEVDAPTSAGDTVFNWLGSQGIKPRHKVIDRPEVIDGVQLIFIYAYVKVSDLGQLSSQQSDVTKVRATEIHL